jgi:hypothetical protein
VTLVSVCIPTRNQARYLAASVRSALGQDVSGLEVLVHDDASTDDTSEVLAGFDDARLRVVRHPSPLGVAANRNTCLERARGRYVAWLDSDDVYLPGSLARRVHVLESTSRVGLVHGAFEVIDGQDRILPPWPAPFDHDTVQPGSAAFRDLLASNSITTSTVVARRSVHDAAGTFSPTIGASSTDWDMWLRIALRSDVAYTVRPVARYRQHEQTISRTTSQNGERLRCDLKVAQRVLHEERRRIREPREAARTARSALAAKALVRAGDLYTAGRRRDAVRAIALAARLAPATAGPRALRLLVATAAGDDYGCYRATRQLLASLAEHVGSPRHAARLQEAAAVEPLYEEALIRLAKRIRRVTARDAQVATVTKWDPTLLWLSRRRGVQFPDRRQLPNGYPQDAAAVIDHLEHLRARGVTHLAFTYATVWWLEFYEEFADHLARRYRVVHRDDDGLVFDLGRGVGSTEPPGSGSAGFAGASAGR